MTQREIDHTADTGKKAEQTAESAQNVSDGDLIYRKAAIDAAMCDFSCTRTHEFNAGVIRAANRIKQLPPAQPEITLESAINYLHSIGWMQEHDRIITESAHSERDTPQKPTKTTSRIWGIREKEPVCSKCGYYLGHWRFQGKRITYCEHCGQAIDWEGWDSDE